MRVLHVINSLDVGGAEKLVIQLFKKLQSEEIRCSLVILKGSNDYSLDSLPFDLRKKIIVLNESSRKLGLYTPLNLLKLNKICRNHDIIHAHLFPSIYFVRLSNLFRRRILVVTEHNTTNRRMKSSILSFFDRYIYNGFEMVISISEDVDKSVKAHLQREHNVTLIKNGIDLNEVLSAYPISLHDISNELTARDNLILQVSSLSPQKDHNTLLQAMSLLPTSYKLLLAGIGSRENELRELCRTLDISSRVIFLGLRNDVLGLMKSVDIIVHSSHYEGLSIACLEAMASGTPLIASDAPGLGRLVRGSAKTFPIGDSAELARNVREIVESDELHSQIADACIKRALQYDLNKMAGEYINVYKNLM